MIEEVVRVMNITNGNEVEVDTTVNTLTSRFS